MVARFAAFYPKKSIAVSWLISYLSVLLIPIIISGVVYTQSNRIVEKEISRTNSVLLKQVQKVMDSKMTDIEQLGLQIAWNHKLQGLMYEKKPLKPHNRYTITEILKDFKVYKVSNTFVDGIYVFLHNSDIILSASTSYNMSLLNKDLHGKEKISFDKWEELSQTYHIKNYLPLEVYGSDLKVYTTIAYVQSLPWDANRKAQATMVILLDKNKFMDPIKDIRWLEQGVVYIIDKNNSVMASSQEGEQQLIIKYDELPDNKIIQREINGQKTIISCISSQVSNWKYVFALPSYVFLEKVEYIRRLTWISLLLCVVLGGIVAYLFTKFNYNPIRDIVQSISNRAGITMEGNLNEYQFIRELISNTFDEKDKVYEKLEEQNRVLRSSFLAKLIKGEKEYNLPLEESLSSFGLNFISDKFAVLLVYIEDFSRLFEGEEKENSTEQLRLVRFIISNIIEELIGKNHKGFVTEVDGMSACLINIAENKTVNAQQDITDAIKEAKEVLNKKLFIETTISVSNIHQGFQGIAVAYQEALEAMEYKMVIGSGQIIHYNDIVNTNREYNYSLQDEIQLINFVKAGDFDQASKILNEVFRKHFSNKALSLHMAKCLLFDMVSTMIKALNEVEFFCSDKFMETLNPVDRLFNAETVMEMKYHMMDILKKVCQHIQKYKEAHSNELGDQIIKYVQEHYMDANLSITMIADKFDLTAPYLSRQFKDQTGEGLLDYINKVRLKEAKRLLRNPNTSVRETAVVVGYTNSNAFIRAFKKYEGITPGRYQEFYLENGVMDLTNQ